MDTFEVRGGYTHHNIRGAFTGVMGFHEDGRIVGIMNDEGADIVKYKDQNTKLILGLREKVGVGVQLNFWKFTSKPGLAPLVYVVRGTSNEYNGRWAPVQIPLECFIEGAEGNKPLPELEEAFRSREVESILDILSKIEKSRTQSYLDPNLTRDIMSLAEETGHLKLEKIIAFSA